MIHHSRGGVDMDYKKEIIKIVDQIEDQTVLRLIYIFATAGLNEEKGKEA